MLRLDYRHPSVAARAIASAQIFGGRPLLLGLGEPCSTAEERNHAARTWLAIRSLLHTDPQQDTFLLPSGFSPPAMYMASGKPEVWEAIGYQAEGWLTTRFDPRSIQATAALLRANVPRLNIIVQVFWRLDIENSSVLSRDGDNALRIGKDRLKEMILLWRQAGVNEVIYYAPETPREGQLRLFADAVQEVGP